MKRRDFITAIAGLAATWPFAARAQQPDRVRRIGVLMAYAESDPVGQSEVAAFRDALAKAGVDGRQKPPDRTSLERR